VPQPAALRTSVDNRPPVIAKLGRARIEIHPKDAIPAAGAF
jgi:hypothetical protein